MYIIGRECDVIEVLMDQGIRTIFLFVHSLKLHLPLVHEIAFVNKFQLNYKIKLNIIRHIL